MNRDVCCILLIFFSLFWYGCDNYLYQVASKDFDDGYAVEILADSAWEYNQSFYYRIKEYSEIIIPSYFIEVLGNNDGLVINSEGEFIYAFHKNHPKVIIFIYKKSNNKSWPYQSSSSYSLIKELREVLGDEELKLSSEAKI